ncbi:hypothetical protein [Cellulomonas sp. Y8]|uniref:hypothetical protein n=1 Tax=Cellulomonas sp. Y8 TaxID=2591145 RepID=UPI0011C908CB|nr:hypothetical protein [Cellulomonas sp. Y8]
MRALAATVTFVLVGATTAALSSPTTARAFWGAVLLGAVALLVVPFTIATVVHVRARRRRVREHDAP